MFFNTPPVCDRWIEGVAYEFGDTLRYLWSEVYWVSYVNTRFLSNFFSYLIDNTITLHAVFNSIMLTCISVITLFLCKPNSTRDKTLLAVFSGFCLTLVSRGIYKEVYFYASTLYLSSFLIICAILMLDLKLAENKATKRETNFLYVMIFIGSTWLESDIFTILAVTGVIWLVNSLEHKQNDKKTFFPFIFSLICSFAMIVITYCVHKDRKLARSGGEIRFTIEPIVNLIRDNSFLFVILSVLMILNIVKIKKECRLSHNKKRGFRWLLQIILWSIILVGNLVSCANYIYEVLRIDPNDMLKTACGWFSVQNNSIEGFFNVFMEISHVIFPVFIIFAVISIIYVFYVTKRQLVGVPILLMGCAGTVIVVLGLYPGDRITSGSIFSLIILVGLLAQNIQSKEDAESLSKHWHVCYCCIGIIACINVHSVFIFLHSQNEVAEKRQMIADEVKKQQALGMWDYDSFVIMPIYCANAAGMELVGEARKNPINIDAYYPFLLHYYDLDADTKILFSNNSSLQLVKLIQNESTGYLYANSLREYENVLYKFQIMEQSDDEDADLLLISESEWQSENMWPIPSNCLNNKNLRYRCSIKENDVIINETDGEVIPWQENRP